MPEPRTRTDVRLDTSLELLLERAPAAMDERVLATVVATAGSTYRKSGARMLIMADGSYLGLLSGGCMEADLAAHARQVIEAGTPRAIEYDMRGAQDDPRLDRNAMAMAYSSKRASTRRWSSRPAAMQARPTAAMVASSIPLRWREARASIRSARPLP